MNSSSSFPLFALPHLMQGLCFKQMDGFDLICWTLGNKIATEAVSLHKYSTPDLHVTITWDSGRFNSQFYHFNENGKVVGMWNIQSKNKKRPRNMKHIGADSVVIHTYPSSSITDIHSSNPISTTTALMDHFKKIYRKVNYSIRFEGVDLGEHALYKWKHLSEASKIELIDSNVYPHHIQEFQSMLRPHQELLIERGSVELENCPKVKKITINASKYFTANKFNNYDCEQLEVRGYTINHNDYVEFLTEWMGGSHKNLKTFTLFDADKGWLIYRLKPFKYEGEVKTFHESDSGLIDCSEGYYIMRNDGTLGTLVFNENGVMQFVVWL
ncbi:hypothetical protein CRE_29658 [Caenorhabditis remanei]|uniref:Sdz-33 F-box domain-containing protein n=2 Tax=Caenorhabditis remanei TaxID=31234 RepID=E3LV16_CAERE|nr:hypothetical protein CRE_29658 [Caenorhabditis remanei]